MSDSYIKLGELIESDFVSESSWKEDAVEIFIEVVVINWYIIWSGRVFIYFIRVWFEGRMFIFFDRESELDKDFE